MEIEYVIDDTQLTVATFLDLVNKVWPGVYQERKVKDALDATTNITARQDNRLVGCVRILTDGYFFTTITEILVAPEYQRQGIGAKLMDKAWEYSPSSLSFGVQPGNEAFFEQLGFARGLDSYQKKKDRDS